MDMRGESREYYHICTEGLEKKLLFRDRRDYIYGMNSIPVCALKFNVSVLAFCLMDNHVHFITEGRYEECSAFINEYKRRCSQRLRSKYSEVQALHDLKVSIHHIDSEEYLLSSVAYVRGIRSAPGPNVFLSIMNGVRRDCISGQVRSIGPQGKSSLPTCQDTLWNGGCRCGASAKQLARLTGISSGFLEQLLQ